MFISTVQCSQLRVWCFLLSLESKDERKDQVIQLYGQSKTLEQSFMSEQLLFDIINVKIVPQKKEVFSMF